jgi:dienelactone hydrolase
MPPAVDPLNDFRQEPWTAEGMTFPLYISPNAGAPVIVLHEIPNLTPQVADFARHLVKQGFKVYMPSLVGQAGRPAGDGALEAAWRICVQQAFRGLVGTSTRPVVKWIRALARRAAGPDQKQRVGVIGMCFSGGFALGAATEPAVSGAVACQPGLPLAGSIPVLRGVTGAASDIDVSDRDQQALLARLHNESLRLQAYRFQGDTISPCARMRTLTGTLGENLDARCLPDDAANPAVKTPKHHSVVTLHLIDREGQPTQEARDRMVAFLDWRLRNGREPPEPSDSLRRCTILGCAQQARP